MTVALVVALVVIVPVVVIVHAVGERRESLDARRTTIRAIRRLQVLIDECGGAGPEASVDAVRRALTDVLGLDGCAYEPEAVDDGIPTLEPDGTVSALVLRRVDAGMVLPERLALAAGRGRFVLVGHPERGTTPEQRVVAAAMAGLVAAAVRPARR